MNSNLKCNKAYVYEIVDESVEDTERFIVKGNIEPENMDNLVFYLQYEFHKMLDEATLIPFDIENILTKHYGFESVENIDDLEINNVIDLIDNVQRNLELIKVESFIDTELFYSEGILDDMKDIMIDIVYNNPDVFADKFLELTIKNNGTTYYPISNRLLEEVLGFKGTELKK